MGRIFDWEDYLLGEPEVVEPAALDSSITFPAPYFGGKRRAAAIIWERMGDVGNWVEPFGGTGAVLLARPADHRARVETLNDLDGLLVNVHRALRADPLGVADVCDYPVTEVDLYARHRALVAARAGLTARLEADPRYYDVELAGWWLWGASAWIGDGWCNGALSRQLPAIGGKGVHAIGLQRVLHDTFARLAARLRYVRFPCGDWKRVLTPAVTWRHGLTGILFDPPYTEGSVDYAVGGRVSADVRAWCAEHWDDRQPNGDPAYRLALCGYEGEHDEIEALGWEVVAWKAGGGYGNQRKNGFNHNARRERIWFSPHCLRARPRAKQLSILGGGVC